MSTNIIFCFVLIEGNIFFNSAKFCRNRKTTSVIIQEFPLKSWSTNLISHFSSLQNKNKKTSALTYEFYCFKPFKIILLWQTPTIEQMFNADSRFIYWN